MTRRNGIIGLLALVLGIGAWLVLGREGLADRMTAMATRTKSLDNLKSLFTVFLDQERRLPRTPLTKRLTGKAYVLSIFVRGNLDPANLRHLRLLFAPGREPNEEALRTLLPRYRALTLESLATATNLGDLTSHAGRGSRPSTVNMSTDFPIIADLVSSPDVALIGFADGSVGSLDRKELGLGPNDPIIPGPDSSSRILRRLAVD